jgi:hypothetical protein
MLIKKNNKKLINFLEYIIKTSYKNMNVFLGFLVIYFLNENLLETNAHKHSDKPLLLLVSFDGFRWDYLNKYNLPNFNSLKRNSSYADFIYNQFVTGKLKSIINISIC